MEPFLGLSHSPRVFLFHSLYLSVLNPSWTYGNCFVVPLGLESAWNDFGQAPFVGGRVWV